jgi:gamma-glutamyltranspeptidase/glutathione hydrolase
MGHNSAPYLHTLIEAKKLAYADLAGHVADPDFMKVTPRHLLDTAYLRRRAALIDPARAADRPAPGAFATDSETIYLSVADAEGNMVSFICSIFEYFGSGVVVPGTGFALQNRGAGFTLEAGHPNRLAPGKRPFHTIIPGFITKDGEPFLAFGVMGGDFQPLGQVQIVMNLLDFGMNTQEAGDAPRFAHEGGRDPAGAHRPLPGELLLESGFPYETARELMTMGHTVRFDLGGYGGYQAIRFDSKRKVYFGASESRKDGQASGY